MQEDAVSDDPTTVTYKKDSYLYLDSRYVGSNDEVLFSSKSELLTELGFWYHMYGAGTFLYVRTFTFMHARTYAHGSST
jgi:hypothetical protein